MIALNLFFSKKKLGYEHLKIVYILEKTMIIKIKNCITLGFKLYLKISLIKEKKYSQWMKFGKN